MARLNEKKFETKTLAGGLVHRRRVPNGCGWPVFRPEMSRSRLLGAMGNDAASSAQSKCAEGGETGHCWGFWGELGVLDVFRG
jgi:hypothetical protein